MFKKTLQQPGGRVAVPHSHRWATSGQHGYSTKYVHPCAHSSTIYNGQAVEAT